MLDLQTFGERFLPVLFGLFLRSSVLVIAAAVIVFLFRSRTAELRHWVCHGTLYSLLALPLIQWTAPPFRHASAALSKWEPAMFADPRGPVSNTRIGPNVTITVTPIRAARPFRWALLILAGYGFVSCALLFRLLLDLRRLGRLVDRSEPILDLDMRELGNEIWLQSLSRYKPQIRVSKAIRVPVAVGLEQTTILLPPSYTLWSSEKLRATLIHEMAHVRRDDPQTVFLASFSVCLFWLNPLVYWLRRTLLALAEEACDEVALRDFRPENYARILIEFATEVGTKGGRLAAASTAAVQRSMIKRRLERIFSLAPHVHGNQALVRAVLITFFIPGLYLASSARFDQDQAGTPLEQQSHISIASQQQADELESKLL
ncbi:MAG: M56 family metallopeptidase, partial [Acidobacteriaceae bacterium]|nr:M56 family metallopeptidase [Acidobacteriaceae bacterium]